MNLIVEIEIKKFNVFYIITPFVPKKVSKVHIKTRKAFIQ